MRFENAVLRASALFFLLCASLCPAGCAAPAKDALIRSSWDVSSLFGVRVGYDHTVTRRIARPQPMIETVTVSETRAKYFGVALLTHEVEKDYETLDGALLRETYSVSGAQTSDSEAVVEDGKLVVTTHTGGTTHVNVIPWDPQVLGPEAEMRKLRESGFPLGKPITFKEYMREINKIVTTRITIEGREKVTILGEPRELYKATELTDELPGVVAHIWFDETGYEFKCVINDGSEQVEATREEALASVTYPNPADLATLTAIASNVKFDRPKLVQEALYRLEGPLDKLQLDDRRQTVEGRGPGWALLRVKALGDALQPSAQKPDPKYLAASAYIQSDDPDIRRLASENVSPSASPAAKAKQLALRVARYITKSDYNVGLASAKETLISREGDCKEHSILLAALLRAAGIPARVAVGVTYEGGQFFGHMWVEAFLNDWTALDATLSDGEIVDATHIKLAVSALDGPTADDAALVVEAQAVSGLKVNVQEFKVTSIPATPGAAQ